MAGSPDSEHVIRAVPLRKLQLEHDPRFNFYEVVEDVEPQPINHGGNIAQAPLHQGPRPDESDHSSPSLLQQLEHDASKVSFDKEMILINNWERKQLAKAKSKSEARKKAEEERYKKEVESIMDTALRKRKAAEIKMAKAQRALDLGSTSRRHKGFSLFSRGQS